MKCKDLCTTVGALRLKWRLFCLRRFQHFAVHFAGRCLIDFDVLFLVQLTGSLKDVECSAAGRLQRIDRLIKGHTDVTLSTEVVNLVGFDVENQIGQALTICQIPVVQKQSCAALVRIVVDMVDSTVVNVLARRTRP